MLGASFDLVHSLHGTHTDTDHRKPGSVAQQTTVLMAIILFLALVLYVGAINHRTNDTGGESIPDRLRHVDPLLAPILVCLCTFVTMSEYTFSNLVYLLLHGRVHHMVMTFGIMAVSVACNVAIEYFILQTTGNSASLYWAKNCGICMAIYLRDAVSDLQKWQSSTKRD